MKTHLFRSALILGSLLLVAAGCQAIVSSSRLSDEQVSAAIERGISGRSHQIGLRLIDLSGQLCATCQATGYVVTIYTPEQWIEQAAQYAHRDIAPFSLADVPEEMRQPMLHVVAMPSTSAYLNGDRFSWASSFHHVVLADTARNIIVAPVAPAHGSAEANRSLPSSSFASATVSFDMADVNRIRTADPKGEFLVVVKSDNKNKLFRVRERELAQLFGAGAAPSQVAEVPSTAKPTTSAKPIATAKPIAPSAGAATAFALPVVASISQPLPTSPPLPAKVESQVPPAPSVAHENVAKPETAPAPTHESEAHPASTLSPHNECVVQQEPTSDETLALLGARWERIPSAIPAYTPKAPKPPDPPAPPDPEVEVRFRSIPVGASVEVDGKYVGITPMKIKLSSGDHTIAFRKRDFATVTTTVQLGGNSLNVAGRLQPVSMTLR